VAVGIQHSSNPAATTRSPHAHEHSLAASAQQAPGGSQYRNQRQDDPILDSPEKQQKQQKQKKKQKQKKSK